MAKLLSTVKRLWTTKPLLVNCVTYGTLYGAAELSQQCLIRKAFVSNHFICENSIYLNLLASLRICIQTNLLFSKGIKP